MTGPQLSRGARRDNARRQVRSRGKRVQRPRQPQALRPKGRKPRYGNAGALAGLVATLGALFFMTGSIFWAVGAVASAGGGAASAYLEYRRELAQVKATGKPIGGKAGDPIPPGVKPVDLDKPSARRRPSKPADAHMARCKAKPPGGPTCRCPDGPNRKGKPKPTTRATGGARRKK